ncbi:class I SAM-dependent methyltransferase [Methylomicrobium agile]|uniref:class I SAM-dependent methyltransferase n=1 Tax=Methylomicrobium agile TaxID=39774 RepID=UPI0004DF79D1|nr:class I SAM-dependent methyltransferase [Methylomicrobium agile]
MEIEEIKTSFANISYRLEDYEHHLDDNMFAGRTDMMKQGMAVNIRVLERTCKAITDFLAEQPRKDNALAWSSVKSGFTCHDMLPYFYQDWFGTPEFAKVENLFSKTITEHCKDWESVAVLGSGACGLLYSVADDFQVSYGVDLSLSTLLVAKQFIQGEPLVFHLQRADWHKVELTPPASTANEIHYVVSDVLNMPFVSGSLSVVITQYMLDFISNPIRLTEEIYRVLKPGGLWINFSNPCRLPSDPIELGRRKLNELPVFFEKMGFDVLSMENERFALLNLEKIYSEAGNNQQLVHFFTLRKNENDSNIPADDRSIQRFFNRNDSVWREIPRIVKGRELALARKKLFGEQGARREVLEISVGGRSFSIPADFALLLETTLAGVDGKNSLRQIYTGVYEKGIGLTEDVFLQLIYVLHVQHYLIELED